MIIYNNHQYISIQDSIFSYENRALHYGDGVFETMIFKNGHICFFEDHMNRLRKAMRSLEIQHELTENDSDIEKIILELILKNNLTGNVRIKLLMHRQWGGLYTPQYNQGILTVYTGELNTSVPETKDYVVFSDDIRNHYHKASSFKLISSGRYVLAGLEMKRKQANDIIITDIDGNLSESLQANLFWIRNGEIYTPGLETGCIEGIIRKQIQQFCSANTIPFHTGFYPVVELERADAVFAGNVAGLTAYKKIEAVGFKTEHDILKKLRQTLL